MTSISPLPKNLVEALNDPNWKSAMVDEYNALIENNTWKLVPHPPNVNVILSIWVFRHKKNGGGTFQHHKARLVGDGRSQQVGVDCTETFSPMVKPATTRTVLSIVFSKSWTIHQIDVKNVFLHDNLNKTVYMYQLVGFKDPSHPNHVCLFKSLFTSLNKPPELGISVLRTLWQLLASNIV